MEYDNKNYDAKLNELEAEKKAMYDFMELFCLFKQMNYDQAVEYMHNKFGEVGDAKTIYFGSKCSLEITLDKRLGVYHFHFNGDDLDYGLLESYMPDWEEKIAQSVRETIKDEKPEVYDKLMGNTENLKSSDAHNITNYMNTYRNISIEKKDKKD